VGKVTRSITHVLPNPPHFRTTSTSPLNFDLGSSRSINTLFPKRELHPSTTESSKKGTHTEGRWRSLQVFEGTWEMA
jgi:hypothetical protein